MTTPWARRRKARFNHDTRPDWRDRAFLSFLARDIEHNPGNLKGLTPDLARRIAELVDGVDFDPDAPIEGDVGL